jgi:hypothetical protein
VGHSLIISETSALKSDFWRHAAADAMCHHDLTLTYSLTHARATQAVGLTYGEIVKLFQKFDLEGETTLNEAR